MRLNICLAAAAATLAGLAGIRPGGYRHGSGHRSRRCASAALADQQWRSRLRYRHHGWCNCRDCRRCSYQRRDADQHGRRHPLPGASQAARFDGLAAPLETVVLTLTPPVGNVLQDAAADTITVNSMGVDAAGLTRQADANGQFHRICRRQLRPDGNSACRCLQRPVPAYRRVPITHWLKAVEGGSRSVAAGPPSAVRPPFS